MNKAKIDSIDLISEMIDAIRDRQMDVRGDNIADANAFTLGYINSALGAVIDNLSPKAKAMVHAEIQTRIKYITQGGAYAIQSDISAII